MDKQTTKKWKAFNRVHTSAKSNNHLKSMRVTYFNQYLLGGNCILHMVLSPFEQLVCCSHNPLKFCENCLKTFCIILFPNNTRGENINTYLAKVKIYISSQ